MYISHSGEIKESTPLYPSINSSGCVFLYSQAAAAKKLIAPASDCIIQQFSDSYMLVASFCCCVLYLCYQLPNHSEEAVV